MGRFTSLLGLVGIALACDSVTFTADQCNDIVTQDGNGTGISEDIANQLIDCFKSNFGDGPYEFDGNDIPDSGGLGKAFGADKTIDGTLFQVSVGNLCGCSEKVDADLLDSIKTAADGSHLTIVQNCGADSDDCPAVTGSDGTTLPSGGYANFYSCPDDFTCNDNGYAKYAHC